MDRRFAALVVATALAAAACGGSTGSTPAPSAATQGGDAPAASAETGGGAEPSEAAGGAEPSEAAGGAEPSEAAGGGSASGAVGTLEGVQQATIQIEAEGSFIDPVEGQLLNAAGRGSGVIIDPSGLALTANHVVTGAATLKIWIGGDPNKTYNARVVAASECSDLAVIQIAESGLPYLDWYPDDPAVGLDVYAAGFPLGDPEYTLNRGIVSKAKAGGESSWSSVDTVLEHDALINPGNSGGPLVTKDGLLVGIDYAGNAVGQSFAIGKGEVDRVLADLLTGKPVTWIGVNGQAISAGDFTGIWVAAVESGSPADTAGIRGGDIITKLEGLVLATDGTMSDYCDVLRSRRSTDTMAVEVLRTGTGALLEGQLNGRQLQ
jgi:serine protease Do